LEEKAAFAIGKGAEGGMRDAQSMLDQLVAFCGNTIHESDVLDIFGFTSVQTVTKLSQNILDSDTVGALRVVHEQSEAGKDLGRLLSDLIQHVRTLLVCQADPEAAAEDLEPDIAEQVQSQSQMASTEQLLRIVDGLADVDARMRWATNKRLHFELGVIQAVQHLNEVSLSDVIEALDGGAAPPPLNRPPVRSAPLQEARRAASPPPPAASPAPAITASPRVAAPQPAPVLQEEPPAPAPAPIRAAAPAPVPAPAPAPSVAISDSPEQIWQQILETIRERRPLAANWAVHATALSFHRGVLKLGFPTTESQARDSLIRDNQRTFLETLASDLLGTAVKFEMVLDPSLKPPPATEMEFGFDAPAAPTPAPKPEPKPAAAPEKKAETSKPDASGKVAPEDFLNDPLIKSAVEQFKLKIAGLS
ncbi:MAG: hypothetical protein U0984_15375, partial [Prosthecobacter sp.]|nr:hypothetical protein [Prosthecobacter sp.]